MIQRLSLFVIFIAALLTLSSCSFLSPVKTPTINTYTLNAPSANATKQTSKGQKILLIATPTANPSLQTDQMVYVNTPYQLNYFAYNRWIAPPTEMLAPLLSQSLENTGCVAVAISAPFTGQTDLILQTNITQFEQEIIKDKAQVTVGINAILLDAATGEIKQQKFEATVLAAQNTPYAGVVATNEAVSSILKRMNRFVCRD